MQSRSELPTLSFSVLAGFPGNSSLIQILWVRLVTSPAATKRGSSLLDRTSKLTPSRDGIPDEAGNMPWELL